jgi:PAT family acetyl-CoA transporter-like MFS transporter 1
MPLILVKITVPLLLFRTERPLVVFSYFYIPRLILCAATAVFVLFIERLQSYPVLFYTLLIIQLGLSDVLVYLQGAARGAFFAQISDKRIGSTYYTLLASLNNLGAFVSTSLVLYTANWLPKQQAYFIEVGVCLLLGCAWLGMSWRLMYRLEELPVEDWHLMLHKRQYHGDHELQPTDDNS